MTADNDEILRLLRYGPVPSVELGDGTTIFVPREAGGAPARLNFYRTDSTHEPGEQFHYTNVDVPKGRLPYFTIYIKDVRSLAVLISNLEELGEMMEAPEDSEHDQ